MERGTPVTVGLVQIGEVGWERRIPRQYRFLDGELRLLPSVSSLSEGSMAYFPHAVALLQAYAGHYARESATLTFLPPLFRRVPLAEAVRHLRSADVVGFSVYVWNVRYSLALARALKRQRPDVLVVMGGPQVPDGAESFLRRHPFVDVVCHGEAERTFCEVLDHRARRAWHGIMSTSFLAADGTFVANARRQRMRDLDEIPSPMLSGVYDELMRLHPEQLWLATWETNRGCPFSCAFCDWGSATASKVSRYGEERLHREIDWLAEHGIQHLFVCDANFGMLSRDVDTARYLADTYARYGLPLAISIQNTKNRTDRSEKIQKIFKESGVISFGAIISLQSLDPTTLKAIKRDNISLDTFETLQRHYSEQGLDTYTDLVIGLPGETYESFTNGVDRVISNGQTNRVVFYECSVLPNAPMADEDYRSRFGIDTVPTRMISAHEPLDRADGHTEEFIDIVVSTGSMSREDWVRARTFAHLTELLFFDRLLHVPLVLLNYGWGVSVRALVEGVMDADPAELPVAAEVAANCRRQSRSVAAGGPQYIPSAEWLSLWWPADQHAFLTLARTGALDAFYHEARRILQRVAAATDDPAPAMLVDDALRLNRAMLALPFQLIDEVVETRYPVGEDYLAIMSGRSPSLRPRADRYRVLKSAAIWMSWADWCADLVLRVNQRRRYLHDVVLDVPDGPARLSGPAVASVKPQ